MHKYVFLDTNVFEQFQPITDINWPELVNNELVTLLVPSITIRELNEHKDGGARGRLRSKAAAVLAQLKKYADNGLPTRIREGVDLDFIALEPCIDFAVHRLDPGLDDDHLIASAIAFALEKQLAPEFALVATGDFGLDLKLRHQPLVRGLSLPDWLRLPTELDSDEKEMRNLQRRVHELENAAPNLSLTFEDGLAYAALTVGRFSDEKAIDIDEILQQERSKRPFLQGRIPQVMNGWHFINFSTPETLEKYNEELHAYFERLRQWLQMEQVSREWYSTTASLKFKIQNKGGAPGNGIHIDVHFPDGFDVISQKKLPKIPERPKPPSTPDQRLAAVLKNLGSFDMGSSKDYFRSPQLDIRRDSNATLSSVKKTNSYVVRFEVQNLKHTLFELLPPVYIHFADPTHARGFQIEYSIVASNYPAPFVGKLDVEVCKP